MTANISWQIFERNNVNIKCRLPLVPWFHGQFALMEPSLLLIKMEWWKEKARPCSLRRRLRGSVTAGVWHPFPENGHLKSSSVIILLLFLYNKFSAVGCLFAQGHKDVVSFPLPLSAISIYPKISIYSACVMPKPRDETVRSS